MLFDPFKLVLGMTLVRNVGVRQGEEFSVAMPAAILPLGLGLVVSDLLARQRVAAEAQSPSGATKEAQRLASPANGSTSTPTVASSLIGAPRQPAVAAGAAAGANGSPTQDPLPQPWSLPVISVAPPPPRGYKAGDTLVVDPGLWQGIPTDAQPKFQWYRDGDEIERDGHQARYRVKVADEGCTLTVQVIYADESPESAGYVSTTSNPITIERTPKRRPNRGTEVIEEVIVEET